MLTQRHTDTDAVLNQIRNREADPLVAFVFSMMCHGIQKVSVKMHK